MYVNDCKFIYDRYFWGVWDNGLVDGWWGGCVFGELLGGVWGL